MKHIVKLCLFLFLPVALHAQGSLLPYVPQNFIGATGAVDSSGKLCTLAAGTSTPLATYSDSTLLTANANPVTLNAAGRPNTGGIYIGQASYKLILYAAGTGNTCNGSAVGAVIWTQDNVFPTGFSNIRLCHEFPGANAGAKIAACIADLPATGGVADARYFESAQTIAQNIWNGVTKPVQVIFGAATFSVSVTQELRGCSSCSIVGIAPGEVNGTQFKWTGTSGGTVFQIYSSAFGNYHDFLINGNSLAGAGLKVNGTNAVGANQRGHFSNITVTNVTQSPGYALYVGSPTNDDISQNTFEHISIYTSPYGLYQEGGQTLKNVYRYMSIFYSTTNAIKIAAGDLDFASGTIISNATVDMTVAAVADWIKFSDNVIEIQSGGATRKFWEFPAGRRFFKTELTGNRIQWQPTDVTSKVLDWNQSGALNFMGNTISSDAGTGAGVLYLNNGAASGEYSAIHWYGNTIGSLFPISLGTDIQLSLDSAQSAAVFGGSNPTPYGIYGTGSQTAGFMLAEPNPTFVIKETDAGADGKNYELRANGGLLTGNLVNDARNASNPWLQVHRSGTTVSDVTFPGALLNVNGKIDLSGGSASTQRIEFKEGTAPSAPAADHAIIYAEDNGSGKTRLCALFSSGAAQCFATQP